MTFGLGLGCRGRGAPDLAAPTLSSPLDAANGDTAMTGSVSTDEAGGTLYWFISTSATPPSAANLKAAVGAVAAGSQAVSGTGVQNIADSGLTASTAYYTHFLHRDAAGNDSAIASADGFTTAAAGAITAPVLTKTSAAGANPMSWSGYYAGLEVGDVIHLEWEVDNVAGAGESHTVTSEDVLAATDPEIGLNLPWLLFADTSDFFADGDVIEVWETIQRGASFSADSNVLTDTAVITVPTASVLFAAAEKGVWYDPSALSTMWTDVAGTTQAAVGDRVARIDDRSGNGCHATQATLANQPYLRQDGTGEYYLEFSNSATQMDATGTWAVSDPLYGAVVGNTTTVSANAGFMCINPTSSTVRTQRGWGINDGSTWKADTRGLSASVTTSMSADSVFEGKFGGTSATGVVSAAVNGGTFTDSAASSIADTTTALRLGEGITNVHAASQIYGIVLINRHPTSGERSDLVAHLTGKLP